MSLRTDPYEANFRLISTGDIVQDDVLGIVREINRRYPELTVQYLDPDRVESLTDKPWRIIEERSDGKGYAVVLEVNSLDQRVLDMLDQMDQQKHDVVLDMETRNSHVKQMREKYWNEVRDENKDIMVSAYKSPKGTYKLPNGLVLTDDPTRKSVVKP